MVPLPLPEIRDIIWILEELFDREVTARDAPALQIGPEMGALLTLLDDSNRVRALWMFDVELANIVGVALAVGHPDKATMASQAGVIPADLRENLAEVVNVAVSGVNGEGRIHVSLGPMAFVDDGSFGNDLWRAIRRQAGLSRGTVLSHQVSVSGYGSGRMTVWSLGTPSAETGTDSQRQGQDVPSVSGPAPQTQAEKPSRGANPSTPSRPPIKNESRSFIRWGRQARTVR
jgi:hypothetical protein